MARKMVGKIIFLGKGTRGKDVDCFQENAQGKGDIDCFQENMLEGKNVGLF